MHRRTFVVVLAALALGALSACTVADGMSGSGAGSTNAAPSAAAKAPAPKPVQQEVPPVGSKLERTDEEWKKTLTPQQYDVLRKHGTERANSGVLVNEHREGTYVCAGCGAPLFASKDKFESGTGWPSFTRPIEDGRVGEKQDRSFFMRRTEVHCDRCGGHLGHVFPDGPAPTGLRYCMNSVAMDFRPADEAGKQP